MTSSLFNTIVEYSGSAFRDFSYVIFGGEVGNPKYVNSVLQFGAPLHLIFVYGPTEATVFSTFLEITPETNMEYRTIPIGKPTVNNYIYILDQNQKIQPPGVYGEIAIGGIQVSMGYINLDDINAEKFIDNVNGNDRVYLTGDIGKYLSNGDILFLKRSDSQCKINGHRIELGEIESKIRAIKTVKEVVVLPVDGNLTAYIELEENSMLDSLQIASNLRHYFYYYMVPRCLIVDHLPTNINGKLHFGSITQQPIQHYKTNLNLQDRILGIWEVVLNTKHIQLNQNFFDSGGNSISLKLLHSLLQEISETPIFIASLFSYCTIKEQVELISPTKIGMKTETASTPESDIAIIGMSANFPQSPNITTFWDNLLRGNECIDIYEDEKLVFSKGVIDDKCLFDHHYFSMSMKKASLIDPVHRLLLQETVKALDNAGIVPDTYHGEIGNLVSVSESTYFEENQYYVQSLPAEQFQHKLNKSIDTASTLVSYTLGLTGPSAVIQSACSSSGMAVHLACQFLKRNEADVMVVGASSFEYPTFPLNIHQNGMIYSEDGHLRSFDKDCSGTVIGEGVGVLVLMPLFLAKEQGYNIRAVIKASGVNNDGSKKQSYTSSNPKSMEKNIRNTLKRNNINPSSIKYIECHGSGTPLGDMIELTALDAVYGNNNPFIGSVKPNIGHLDRASACAAIIKSVLCLENKLIPPTLHFNAFSERINISLKVNTDTISFNEIAPSRIAVNTFGQGGTNVHLVLEEYQNDSSPHVESSEQYFMFPISANSEQSFRKSSIELSNFVQQTEHSLKNIAFTLQRKKNYQYRRAVFANKKELLSSSLLNQEPQLLGDKESNLVFLFPGQGADTIHIKMMYDTNEIFAQYFDQCKTILKNITDYDLKEYMLSYDYYPEEFYQVAVFIIQYCLSKTLISYDIVPASMVGHSLGEITVACLSGIFSLEDTIQFLVQRQKIMTEELDEGAMLAVSIDISVAHLILKEDISIAAINHPSQVVYSGSYDKIIAFKSQLEDAGLQTSLLKVSYPFHSHLMEKCSDKLFDTLDDLDIKESNTRYISTMTGEWITSDVVDPSFWINHMKSTVLFSQSIKKLLSDVENITFVEIGTTNTLLNCSRKCEEGSSYIWNDRTPNIQLNFVRILSSLWEKGLYKPVHDKSASFVPTPNYQFDNVLCTIPRKITKQNASATMREKTRIENLLEEYCDVFPAKGVISVGVLYPDSSTSYHNQGCDVETIFPLGCNSRFFTLSIFGYLVDNYDLKLTTLVTELLPHNVKIPMGGESITLLHLASYTAGLPFYPEGFAKNDSYILSDEEFSVLQYLSVSELYSSFSRCKLLCQPGEKCYYSVFSIAMLGRLLSNFMGMGFNEMVHELFLRKCNFSSTHINLTNELKLSKGCTIENEDVPLWDCPRAMAPPSGIHASTKDVMKLLKHVLGFKKYSVMASEIIPKLLFQGKKKHQYWATGATASSTSWIVVDTYNKCAISVLLNFKLDLRIRARLCSDLLTMVLGEEIDGDISFVSDYTRLWHGFARDPTCSLHYPLNDLINIQSVKTIVTKDSIPPQKENPIHTISPRITEQKIERTNHITNETPRQPWMTNLQDAIIRVISNESGHTKHEIEHNSTFHEMGLDSLNLINIATRLSEHIGYTIPDEWLYMYDTIPKLLQQIDHKSEIDNYFVSKHEIPYTIDGRNLRDIQDLINLVSEKKDVIFGILDHQGAILLRGFNLSNATDFSHVLRALDIKFLSYVDGISPRTFVQEGVFTSTEYPPEYDIPLHNEMSYSDKSPEYISFFCEIPCDIGGETSIGQSSKIYKNIDHQIKQLFIQKEILYIRNLHSGEGYGLSWQKTYNTSDKQEVEKILNSKNMNFSWEFNNSLRTYFKKSAVVEHLGTKLWNNHAHIFHPASLNEKTYESLKKMHSNIMEDLPKYAMYGDNEMK